MLGGNPGTPQNPGSPATNLLYAGEQFDTNLQMYYNRARYYDQNTGRFNRIDPFAGNKLDPQSLHKYTYAHCNPVNQVDPTGRMSIFVAAIIIVALLIANLMIEESFIRQGIVGAGRSLRSLLVVVTAVPMEPVQVRAAASAVDDVVIGAKPPGISSGDWISLQSAWSGAYGLRFLLGIEEGSIQVLEVKVSQADTQTFFDDRQIGGAHTPQSGVVIIPNNTVAEGDLATGVAIFAEWQHDRWLGQGLVDDTGQPQHQDFRTLIRAIPEDKRTGIMQTYLHGWGN